MIKKKNEKNEKISSLKRSDPLFIVGRMIVFNNGIAMKFNGYWIQGNEKIYTKLFSFEIR